MERFKGKVCMITGGASGIGLAVVRRLSAEGAAVVIADTDEDKGHKVASQIIVEGGHALYVKTDVTSTHDVQKLMEMTEQTYGRLDVLHNNAYWTERKACLEVEEWEWNLTMDVILKGSFLCAKYAIPLMRKNGGGSIVNSASIHSLVAFKQHTSYQTAKAGLLGLTRSLALDYAPDIRVNALIIGCVEAPALYAAPEEIKKDLIDRTPLKRYGKPEEIAEAVMYLASEAAAFITGSALVIDGGWTIQ